MKIAGIQHLGLALLRIVPSAIMAFVHGLPKLQNLLNGNFEFPNPIGIGAAPSLFLTVIGEFVAPILIIIGFKTRIAAVPALITMLVAAFITHGADPFAKKELAVLFAVFFAVIFLVGPGKYSIDKK
ncbi:DoxX family protein [Croceitalea sp. MTPC5]|uniref:DoxX family protein n=1 Tax=Croceitalea sp. MTPC5 TaxID=3056565 RepID=UPI002B368487|nr:DoxX family protein [Croceitalea sp. MTPC5]